MNFWNFSLFDARLAAFLLLCTVTSAAFALDTDEDGIDDSVDNCSEVANAGLLQFARITYLNWLVEYMSEKNVDNIIVWQALKRELWLHRVPAWPPQSDPLWKLVRWIKKWLLWLEEWVVPTPIRRWLWFQG